MTAALAQATSSRPAGTTAVRAAARRVRRSPARRCRAPDRTRRRSPALLSLSSDWVVANLYSL